jgi:methyl-accepting chemotaxis protein
MGTVRKELTQLARGGDFDGAYKIFAEQYRPLFNNMIPVYEDIVAQTTASSKKLVEQAISAGNSAEVTSVVLSLAAIAISIVVTWLLTKSVAAQLVHAHFEGHPRPGGGLLKYHGQGFADQVRMGDAHFLHSF